jgi:mRNA interferase HigB
VDRLPGLDLLLVAREIFFSCSRNGNSAINARMRVIARNVLLAYARVHPETSVPLERWYRLVKAANWRSMDDIRHAAPRSKVLNRDRVRFEVAGGNYRLIAAFDFRRQIVFVKFVGSHAEYDAIDALTVANF